MALPLRARRASRVAAALLLVLASAGAAGAQSFQAEVSSLREVALTLSASTAADEADFWRMAIDGDASGAVSAEEYSVFASAVEWAAFEDNLTRLAVYAAIWEIENNSGANTYTVEGRSNLSEVIRGIAPGLRMDLSLDNVSGKGDVTYLSFINLSAPVGANRSIESLWTITYRWPTINEGVSEHRIVLMPPPLTHFETRLPGSFEIRSVEGLLNISLAQGRSSVSGTTQGSPVTVNFAPRAVAFEAFLLVVVAILVPTAFVIYAVVVISQHHRVPEEQLPVVPKYK